MTLKSYVWGIRIINLISLCALALVFYFIDPKAGMLGVILFYVILFFALSGIFNLILLRIREFFLGQEESVANVSLSFRQGILLALLVIALLVLQSLRALFWWDGLLVAGGIFLIELYFLTKTD
jgi:hypothetical protein